MIYTQENEHKDIVFNLNTKLTSLVIMVNEEGFVYTAYWGSYIGKQDVSYLIRDIPRASYLADANGQKDFKLEQMPQIYPSYGFTDLRNPAFSFLYEDGSRTTDLRYKSHRIMNKKYKLDSLPSLRPTHSTQTLELTLEDKLKQVEVIISLTVFKEHDAITQSIKVINRNYSEKLIIEKICSANIDLLESEFDLLHLSGAWGRETHLKRRRIEQGEQSIGSIRGASSHGHNPFAALVTPQTDETHGKVYAMNFVYSGNFKANVEVDMHQNTRFQIGIHPFDFSWTLLPEEEFQAPEVVLVFSDHGLGRMSQIFHRLYRECLIPPRFNSERPILLNSWEANYFDFTKESLLNLAKRAADVGAELFVLDDGWFGNRNDTTSSIGDWYPNKEKIGGELSSLIYEVNGFDLNFGLWFEPEMVSPNSTLFENHPEWAIQVKGRRIETSRDEYVLDLSNPEVCDYIVECISEVLEKNLISYVKWDMNRNFTNLGSTYLPIERQKEQAHRYLLGLYDVLEKLTQRFPEVLFEGCAGGGGRCDPGMLYYMPQIWVSDDTDAIERLEIQYGASMIYPAISMGCHISDIPNHQTGRNESLETRATVAMWGNLGLELDLTSLPTSQIVKVKNELDYYRRIRNLIQFGTLTRLKGLTESNEYAWMFISEDYKQIMVSYVQVLTKPNTVTKRLILRNLEPDTYYKIKETQEIRSGKELMNIGLSIGKVTTDAFSKRWLLSIVNIKN